MTARELPNSVVAGIGGKLFNWIVGAVAGILVVLTFGDRLYATKEDLNSVKTEVQLVSSEVQKTKIYLEIQGKQIADMKQEQAVAFGKMETNIQRLEEILTSGKGR
jgi:hypothetical protein